MRGRLDVVLAEIGLAPSRQKAKELISEGYVQVNGSVCRKAAYAVKDDDNIEVVGECLKYVGRGGLKLEKIVSICKIDLNGKICMDIGASTGGFTDCILQNGAAMVYAVDVGTGQLSDKLRQDERVINMEKTDIRSINKADLNVLPSFISIDVSFISLKLILGHVFELLAENGTVAALIKPQFEAGRENVGKNGIVKSKKAHFNIVADMLDFVRKTGFAVTGICHSPITGSKGNIEYLMCLKKGEKSSFNVDVKELVENTFSVLKIGGQL